jgi:hypothetical protein
MIRGSPRTPDRLPELFDLHVLLSEVCGTMIGTCGLYNLGGSATYKYAHGLPSLSFDSKLSVMILAKPSAAATSFVVYIIP